jgi:hypothetical protein
MAVGFLACAAQADDTVLTMNPANLTIAEGSSRRLTFTVTNLSSHIVGLPGFFNETVGLVATGDSNDRLGFRNVSLAGCTSDLPGHVLNPGASCTVSITFVGIDDVVDSVVDFGVTPASVEVTYCTGPCNGGSTFFTAVDNFSITVTDVITPEPSSTFLMILGFIALGVQLLRLRNN